MRINANKFTKTVGTLLALLMLILVSACERNNNDDSAENGEVTISLTDAKGDFTNYTVDVVSLTLTKQNGTVVEVIPEETRVDFSQYVDMTELLTTATVPGGVYTEASMILSYSNADIFVENALGESVEVTSIKDESGNAITTLDVSVKLVDGKQLIIRRGVPALLSLDFDLKTSNAVEFDSTEVPSVTVSPSLIASLEPDLNKSTRVRGPLQSVNTSESNFKLYLKPFFKSMKNIDRHFGTVTINSSTSTIYTIDGETLTGADGLAKLDTMEKRSGIIVVGNIDTTNKTINATEVYAGNSVPGGNLDGVTGTVLSRTGNLIAIKGATLLRTEGSALFRKEINVTIADTTQVKRQGNTTDFTIADISVGQSISLLGTFTGTVVNPGLDATNGYALLNITEINGAVVNNSASTFPLALNLTRIDKRPVNLFDFSGTGTDSTNDADPEFYEIDTGSLNVSNLALNSDIKVRGFVNAFGAAPADFIAKSIINPGTLNATMQTNWKPSNNNAFSLISGSKITLDFSGAGKFHHIGRGHNRVDLTKLSTGFSLVPMESKEGIYIVQVQRSTNVHTNFAAFAADVQAQIDAGKKAQRITARGLFDSVTGEMSAAGINLHFE